VDNKQVFVKDLCPGKPVRDIFVVCEARQGQARNGPFWSLVLQDSTGRVEAKIFSPASQQYPDIASGRFVLVEGQVGSFRDQTQIVVDRLHLLAAEAESLDLSQFLPMSAVRPEILLGRLEELHRQHLHYPGWRKFCKSVLGDPDIRPRLLAAPGGKAIHHAYIGGLLEHTVSVAELCLKFCDHYPGLDREILLAAATFHDLGKAWELTSGIARDYTDEGRLLGHIVLGLEILEPFLRKAGLEPDLAVHFKHILVSHHGEYAYGSPKRPKTAEALALHYADNLDAKMNTVDGVFEGTEEAAWTPFQKTMDRYLYRARPTPSPLAASGNGRSARGAEPKDAAKDDQCLLPLKA
jgi:3'-5' exoribonuclease